MSYESEIKKLERRWEENPKQYFAPLADAFRKNGDYRKALELIEEGLLERPNYVSAHIVLGRTRVDMGENDEAALVFEQVLDFDAENIIALNQLAELSDSAGDPEGAVRWLGRLLEVDPMNDEAGQRLKEIRGDSPESGRTSEPEFPEIPVETLSEAVDGSSGDQPFIDTSFADVMDEPDTGAPAEVVGDTVVEMEPPVPSRRPAIDELKTAVDMDAIAVDETEPSEPVPPAEFSVDDPGIAEIPTQKMVAIGDEALPPAAETDGSMPDHVDPIQAEEGDEIAAPEMELTYQVSEEEDKSDDPVALEPELIQEPEAEPPADDERPDVPVETMVSVDENAAGPAEDDVQPEPFVTETMARVYAQQGMIAEAVDVYRKLIELNPADEHLADELAALETSADAEPVEAEASSGPRYSVVLTGGTSARGLLQGILAATIEPTAAAAQPREPFAAPQQGPSASRLSFDDFYGATGAAPATDRGDDSESAGDDDFKSWLKGLKS